VIKWLGFGRQYPEVQVGASNLRGTGRGIAVLGRISPLSHAGEIADYYGVPAHFEG
jgi:hypothetical protein